MKAMNMLLRLSFLLLFMGIGITAQAQTITVQGTVTDPAGIPVIGANITVKNQSGIGAVTDFDGNFVLQIDKKSILLVSYIGYIPQEIDLSIAKLPLKITLKEDVETLSEVVVIGYGSVQKKDLTGSVTMISDKDFQKGAISTPDGLISGKIAGVQITSGGGSPGSGNRIRIRGGASLNASNDPLIVIDGVPIESSAVAGAPSILSSINPNDIESMNVMKDASATAIYGSRASNGVIIITTKKGKLGQPLNINFSTQFSLAQPNNLVDVLSADELRALVKKRDDSFSKFLGKANTDWQKEIYRTAFGTDNNLSLSGSTSWLPYRVSLGYYNQDGILDTDNMQRVTGDISLTPRLLNGDLSIDLNIKGTQTKNRYANRAAIGAAVIFDPTQPIMAPKGNKFGNYFTWMNGDVPNNLATANPVSLLQSRKDEATVYRTISNLKVAYKLPFLESIRLNLNLGYDFTKSDGKIYVPTWAAHEYLRGDKPGNGGTDNIYKQKKHNKLLDFYANYNEQFNEIDSRIDLMVGYSYQDWKTGVFNYEDKTASGYIISKPVFLTDYPQNTLISFYSRLNYTFKEKYLLTATLRYDGSSRFSKDERWGIFPSVALAWRVKDEGFLKDVEAISDLKLRLGYGITGQQDGIKNYGYLPVYTLSNNTAMYQLGNQFYNMYRPTAYDANIKWEQTHTYNAGIDFGFLDQRINGNIDIYYKKTKDLLNEIPIPAGSNFSNRLLTNVGNIENKGIEMMINANAIDTKDWSWDLGFNFTYNKTEITKLTQTEDPNYLGVNTGVISGGTGATIQIHSVGQVPNSFFVYKQLYDKNNNPIEGAYADLNGDGIYNEKDLYCYKKPEPDFFMGFNTSVRYQRLTLSTSLRANIGNYIYDNLSSNLGVYRMVLNPLNFIQNTTPDIYTTQFFTNRFLSDYYVKNASFLKMDNIALAYDFGKLFKGIEMRAGVTVQNVFTITKYKGVDPEIPGGIDNNFYPNPRTYSLNFLFNF